MPPANDNFANRIRLVGASGGVAGTNVDATAEVDEPFVAPLNDAGSTVWYDWEATDSGTVRLALNVTFTDAFVGIYTGDVLVDLSGEQLDFGSGTFNVEFEAVAGTVYSIQVGGFNPATAQGTFTMTWLILVPDQQGIMVAFDSDTFETDPEWVRLDDPNQPWKVNGYQISRGRASELDKTAVGTATIALTDTDGSFDPSNPLSPFYGQLNPLKQAKIMIQNPATDEWRTLFTGFVSEWPADIHKTTRIANIQLELVDGMSILNGIEMYPAAGPQFGSAPPFESEGDIYYPATTGTQQVQKRINDALTDAEWPSAWRHIFSGNIDLQEVVYARGEPVLTVILDAADAEFPNVANFLIGRRGEAIFRGRYARFAPEDYVSTDDDDIRTGPAGTGGRLWFWDAGGRPELDATTAYISDLSWRRSEHDIINTAQAVPKDADFILTEAEIQDQVYEDPTSIALYGRRSGPNMENLLVEEGNTPPGQNMLEETLFYAEYYVENYKNPLTRITRLVFRGLPLEDPYAEPTWGLLCGVEIGDVIHVTTSQFDGNAGFDDDYFVEGIRYDVSPAAPGVPDMTMELDVSPRGFFDHNPWGTTIPADDTDVLAT